MPSSSLTRPSLMFLDEPTSGLDPGHEENVMQLLRTLADGGRIVIVVTHSTQSLYLCDRLLFLAPGGVTAFFGPPSEALEYFQSAGAGTEYPEIFRRIDEDRTVDWQGRFRSDSASARAGLPQGEQPTPHRPTPPRASTGRSAQRARRHQWSLLTQRYLSVIANDRGPSWILALQAPLFALLFLAVFSGTSNLFSVKRGLQGTVLVWLTVIGATWLGTSNAIREVVKESSSTVESGAWVSRSVRTWGRRWPCSGSITTSSASFSLPSS